MRAVALAALLCAGLAQAAEPPAQRPRDAAEAVQEGNVSQWLEHYQRERGEEWARQRQDPPPAAPEPAPAGGTAAQRRE
jgi:hypothetical protein